MGLFQHLSGFALSQLVGGVCKSLGVVAGAGAGEAVAGFLGKRFRDHSLRLTHALGHANDQAWHALEVALAGDALLDRVKTNLATGEERAFRAQVQAFLQATPFAGLPGHGDEFRTLALKELRAARKAGLLAGGRLTPQTMAEQAGHLATFGEPGQVLDAQARALEEMAGECRGAGYSTLADLITLTTPDGQPLIVLAVRYFFRREVENDSALFNGLAFSRLEELSQSQEAGFNALASVMHQHGEELGTMVGEVKTVVVETRTVVQDMRQQLRQTGDAMTQAVGQQHALRRIADDSRPAKVEQDIRLGILNSLLKTPHRKLDALWPLHAEMATKDPLFYAHLAAWYTEEGEVRDHKEMFVVALSLSEFEGNRDVGLALLRQLPPYQVTRVIDFIHGTKDARSGEHGLGRNLPRSLRTEVTRYLREREANPEWFDSTALVARKALKRMYALLHVRPGERAQKILFDDAPPADSRVAGLKRIAHAGSPEEQARAVVEARLPFRIALSVLQEVTPKTMEALIDRMSPQELINSMGLLQRRGALANPDLKALIDLKLEEAKRHKRVSTFKGGEALKAVALDADTRRKLEDVADARVRAKGRITRPTALLIDKSGSMELTIDVGRQIAAMVSTVCEKELFVYAFDRMAYPVVPRGKDLTSWQQAFRGISANGQTACGAGLEAMLRKKQVAESVILVTDEEEYDPPYFVESYLKYQRELGVTPAVCIVRVPDSSTRLEDQCKRAGIAVTTFDFTGDYYALPNLIPLLEPPSELDLLMEIMEYPLPTRTG